MRRQDELRQKVCGEFRVFGEEISPVVMYWGKEGSGKAWAM